METAVKGGNPMNRKTIRISEKRQLTIPQKFFEALGFSTEAECILRGNELCCARSGNKEAVICRADPCGFNCPGVQRRSASDRIQENAEKGPPGRRRMLTQAEQAARGESESSSYEDVFGTEEE